MSVIRGTSLTGYPALVTELGGDPAALLGEAGIRPDDVGRFDVFFAYPALIDALEVAARATGTPDFGRRLGARQGIEILGPVGVAARTTGTVADAFAIFEHYLAAYSPAIGTSISPMSDERLSFFEFKILSPVPRTCPQVVELSLGVTLRVLRFLLGTEYNPVVVWVPHNPLTPRPDYLHYFSCTPRFAQPRAGFTMQTSDLTRPLVRDELAHRAMLEYLDLIIDRREPDLRAPVRELIRHLLPAGAATVPIIAGQLRLHPKTLQRRLAAEGTGVGTLVDEVRRELARHYLTETDVTCSHLARELGYSEQSALARACQRWFGVSPRQLRTGAE
ncbi:AraC family transcriptional regulator [Skermania piniformis]|uniref:AraC family transcriptional regulator n=1 Tax=Skermania pinensis TaxID=39122 RepID=A0ABX8S9A0_9ACTN|nr:AraC family transcriptional regulator [Skermania piniformis]QXQ13564.1 AraC family transcriptional regulator [Skermania piniformis]